MVLEFEDGMTKIISSDLGCSSWKTKVKVEQKVVAREGRSVAEEAVEGRGLG